MADGGSREGEKAWPEVRRTAVTRGSQAQWHVSAIPADWVLRQEDEDLEDTKSQIEEQGEEQGKEGKGRGGEGKR